MFIHQTRLTHLLKPSHYFDPEHFELECEKIFRPSWQFACTRSECANPGDFVTLEMFGTPILIRNFGGCWKAFQNVCPHRHSMLTCEPSGNCDVLRCQYHGWEFNEHGRTGKIPEAKAFRPWDRENSHLKPIRLEHCGDLLFVTLSDDTPALSDWMSPLFDHLSEAFSTPHWRMAEVWEFDAPCNWKVPTENTLESYHVAAVHPTWMGGELPSEENSHHHLTERYTKLDYEGDTSVVYRQAKVARYLGGSPDFHYRHWHIHPNIAFCMTDTFNYLATCLPTSPTTCRVRTRMFPLQGTRRNPWASLVRHVAWRMGRRLMYGIFNEDRGIFGAQQRGIQASDRPGVIGAREERIHVFQRYVCRQTGIHLPETVAPDPLPESTASCKA